MIKIAIGQLRVTTAFARLRRNSPGARAAAIQMHP
jgi:hypothetical protein